MEKNVIYTDAEYMAQGFSLKEIPMIRRHDELFNLWIEGKATEDNLEEMAILANALEL